MQRPGRVKFTRLAVTREQIDEYELPTALPKATDKRSFDDTETVQAEAFPPDVLMRIVRDAIDERLNLDAYNLVLRREENIRTRLAEELASLDLDDDDGEDAQ